MNLEVEFLGEHFIAVATWELCQAPVDHFLVLVEVAFLGELHVTLIALVGLLSRVSPQVVEVLAHRENGKAAGLAGLLVFVLALVELEKPGLGLRPQEVVDAVLVGGRNVDVLIGPSALLASFVLALV